MLYRDYTGVHCLIPYSPIVLKGKTEDPAALLPLLEPENKPVS